MHILGLVGGRSPHAGRRLLPGRRAGGGVQEANGRRAAHEQAGAARAAHGRAGSTFRVDLPLVLSEHLLSDCPVYYISSLGWWDWWVCVYNAGGKIVTSFLQLADVN